MVRTYARCIAAVAMVFTMAGAARAEAPLAAASCAQALADEARVELIWYPSSEYFVVSHTELIAGDQTWDGYARYKTSRPAAVTDRAARAGGRGFVRIALRATPGELARIEDFMRLHESSRGTCSGGLCRAIRAGSGIKLPHVIGQVPTLLVMYLVAAKVVGYDRIKSIEWVGPRGWRNFIRPASLGFVGPLFELNQVHDWGNLAVHLARALVGH